MLRAPFRCGLFPKFFTSKKFSRLPSFDNPPWRKLIFGPFSCFKYATQQKPSGGIIVIPPAGHPLLDIGRPDHTEFRFSIRIERGSGLYFSRYPFVNIAHGELSPNRGSEPPSCQ